MTEQPKPDPKNTPKHTHICPRCGGHMAVCSVSGGRGGGSIYLNPAEGNRILGTLLGPNIPVVALACSYCGYTEFYASNPSSLSDA